MSAKSFDDNDFRHTPILEGQLRLLTIRRSPQQYDPIECELDIYEQGFTPPYEALSYLWGPGPATETILLNGCRFAVRMNLHRALSHLRQRRTNCTLWVDVLCVDPSNKYEKGHQIRRIGDIFRNAKTVVAYLGEATASSDQLIDYLAHLDDNTGSQLLPSSTASRAAKIRLSVGHQWGLHDLSLRAYFQRAWVLQELAPARAVVFQCGSKAIPSTKLIRAADAATGIPAGGFQGILNLLSKPRGHGELASTSSLFDLLQISRYAQVKDQRDKIFALLPMVREGSPMAALLPDSDYKMSHKELMRVVIAELCFCELAAVPEPSYDTIDEFLSDISPIRRDILEHVFESSRGIDLESLLQNGMAYTRIDYLLVQAASRNKSKGDAMVRLLYKAIDEGKAPFATESKADAELSMSIDERMAASQSGSEEGSAFSDVSISSANIWSSPEDVEVFAWHVVSMLLAQDTFADLCYNGFNRKDLAPDRLARYLRRIFKIFGETLLSESPSYSAEQAVRLILRGSRRMAALIRGRYDLSYKSGASFDLRAMSDKERRARTGRTLQKFTSVGRTEGPELHFGTTESSSDSGEDEEPMSKTAASFSLEQIDNFILSSQAFNELIEDLADFLESSSDQKKLPSEGLSTSGKVLSVAETARGANSEKRSKVQESLAPDGSRFNFCIECRSRRSSWTKIYETLTNWTTRPDIPQKGLHRVQYTCSCGETMFVDVKERRTGGLERFKSQLAGSMALKSYSIRAKSGGASAGMPDTPQEAHVRCSYADGASEWTKWTATPNRPSHGESSREAQSIPDQQAGTQSSDGDWAPRYLLLCVNTRSLTQLTHVNLRSVQNDQLLFDRIRTTYWESRKHDSWHYGLLTPQWLLNRFSNDWKEWLETVHLRVPRSAELIRFRLVPYHTRICPDKIRLELPPEDQVKVEKNYHYDPCPAVDAEVLSIPKFSHLLKPGIHSYDFWLKTFPKKLRAELDHQPAVVGWGLIIHEGWDTVVLLSSILGLTILVGVAVLIYAVITHDASSAFGLGAYAIAVVTLMFTVKYWAWQENETT